MPIVKTLKMIQKTMTLIKSVDFTSTTLIRVLESKSNRFTSSLFSALIGNIVISVAKNKKTFLQLPLRILFFHSNTTISHLYDYGAISSYDVARQFKKSAAAHSVKGNNLHGVP